MFENGREVEPTDILLKEENCILSWKYSVLKDFQITS